MSGACLESARCHVWKRTAIRIVSLLVAFPYGVPVLTPNAARAQGAEEGQKLEFSGRISTRYRGQWNRDDRDHDLLQYLNFDLRNLFTPRLSLHGFLRGGEDVDDTDPVFDWTNYDVQDRIYDLYLEVEGLIPKSSFRVGRQYYDGLEGVQFDGVRFMRDETGWLSWQAFGGRYVTFYDEDLRDGTEVAGAQITARPLRTNSFSAEYLRLMDFPAGDDDYLNFSLRQQLRSLNFFAQYSVLNGAAKDLSARVYWLAGRGWTISARYFRLLHTLEELSNEFDPYFPLFGPYMQFHQYDLDLTKFFGDHFSINAGYSGRQLSEESDESIANREFNRYFASVSLSDLFATGLGVSATFDRWVTNDDNETYSLGGEINYRLKKKLDASVGTYYSKYKYDVDTITERINVRTYYAALKYYFNPKLYLSLRGEREDDDSPECPYGKVEVRMTYSF